MKDVTECILDACVYRRLHRLFGFTIATLAQRCKESLAARAELFDKASSSCNESSDAFRSVIQCSTTHLLVCTF